MLISRGKNPILLNRPGSLSSSCIPKYWYTCPRQDKELTSTPYSEFWSQALLAGFNKSQTN